MNAVPLPLPCFDDIALVHQVEKEGDEDECG
jgi:hypothetical protein